MAQKVNIVLVDDIDHTDADETVTFGLDGKNYEIDLNTKNANALREALAPYVGHARRAGGSTRRASSRGGSSRSSAGDIREWAKAEAISSAVLHHGALLVRGLVAGPVRQLNRAERGLFAVGDGCRSRPGNT